MENSYPEYPENYLEALNKYLDKKNYNYNKNKNDIKEKLFDLFTNLSISYPSCFK